MSARALMRVRGPVEWARARVCGMRVRACTRLHVCICVCVNLFYLSVYPRVLRENLCALLFQATRQHYFNITKYHATMLLYYFHTQDVLHTGG